MGTEEEPLDQNSVLESKRSATQYQILVQIADHQPAISQQEIADAIGITAQAVSDYLQDLLRTGYVLKHGRGRYEVTKEGVDWLISQTDTLRQFIDHVSADVIGQVDIESAIANADITDGQPVSLSMHDGVLHATPGDTGSATAVAVTTATANHEVGVTDFKGILDFEVGKVTVVSIPSIQDGGSEASDIDRITTEATNHALLATIGTEALVAARIANHEPDIRFGTPEAVQEAATKGLDVLVLAVPRDLSPLTELLRDRNISYEVIEPT